MEHSHSTPNLQLLYKAWDQMSDQKSPERTQLTQLRFDEIIGSFFMAGRFAYFIIDFYDMRISNVSSSFRDLFGLAPDSLTLTDILQLLHPDDVGFVAKAEELAAEMLYNKIGRDKAIRYKTNYCFFGRMADGTYELFLHQAVVLTVDEAGRFSKVLNIITNIHHLTSKNNYKLSLIGLFGEPSFFNLDVTGHELPGPSSSIFTKRETELISLLALGYTNKDIAVKLFISIETVKNHRKNIIRKAGVKTSAELISRCLQDGVIKM